MPTDEAPAYVERLVAAYLAERQPSESFQAFAQTQERRRVDQLSGRGEPSAASRVSLQREASREDERWLWTSIDERIVLDDWEAGELSVEYDDHEPQEVIEWALETFAQERVAICTSFQADGMAILDMAWRIRPDVRVFTVDTGRLPQETYELIDTRAQALRHRGRDVLPGHQGARRRWSAATA